MKNLLVGLAPAAAGAFARPAVALEVVCAFVCFCLLSSATYLVNDVRDREQDRRHPRKRLRPVAAGELAPRGAIRLSVVMGASGLALALAVRPALVLVGVAYVSLTTSYSLWLRRVAFVDVLAVAGGFVLRATGGAAAAGVGLSRSFLIVTCACALFLVAGKRYSELLASRARIPSRTTLRRYSRRSLRAIMSASAAAACAAYAWWALGHRAPGPWRELSMVPFILWLERYLRMTGRGAGEAPEELLLTDWALLAYGLLWLTLFTVGVYAPA